MKWLCWAPVGIIAVSGCVLSIADVVPEGDALFDARLLGSWEQVSGSERAVVSRAAGNTYAITYTGIGAKTNRFQARLGRLDDRFILDAWPAEPLDSLAPNDAGLLVAAHLPVFLTFGDDEVG